MNHYCKNCGHELRPTSIGFHCPNCNHEYDVNGHKTTEVDDKLKPVLLEWDIVPCGDSAILTAFRDILIFKITPRQFSIGDGKYAFDWTLAVLMKSPSKTVFSFYVYEKKGIGTQGEAQKVAYDWLCELAKGIMGGGE